MRRSGRGAKTLAGIFPPNRYSHLLENMMTNLQSNSRRQFLKNAAALAGGVTLSQNLFAQLASPKQAAEAPIRNFVGSNLYGWGQYYGRMKKDVNACLDEVLSALRDSGYDYLEGFLDTKNPENNGRLAERMRAKGLKPVCIYSGAALHDAAKVDETIRNLIEAAKVCQQAGFKIIDVNPQPIGREKTDEELKTQVKGLNQLGAELKSLGLRLGIHNHMPEMASNAREFHYEMRQTDPALVGLNYDVHWVFKGGLLPKDCLREYGRRIVSWHLRQSRNGIWWEDLDSGDIDFEAVARYARQHRLTAPYTVELAIEKDTQVTRSVVENHRRSREFVRKVFGS